MSEVEEMEKSGPFMRTVRNFAVVVGAFAGVFAAIAAFDPAKIVWCKDFGTLCTFPLETLPTPSATTRGNNCSNGFVPLCIDRSDKKRVLDTRNFKVFKQVAAGQFTEIPSSSPADGVGWIVDTKRPPTGEKICVNLTAHTTACENPQSITGKLVANETQPLSSLWLSDVCADKRCLPSTPSKP